MLLSSISLAMTAPESGNMNGLYKVASGGKFDVKFNTDYKSKVRGARRCCVGARP